MYNCIIFAAQTSSLASALFFFISFSVVCVCVEFLDALIYFLSRFADLAAFGFVSTALYVYFIAILVCMFIGTEHMS